MSPRHADRAIAQRRPVLCETRDGKRFFLTIVRRDGDTLVCRDEQGRVVRFPRGELAILNCW